jgi:hypothetical protein
VRTKEHSRLYELELTIKPRTEKLKRTQCAFFPAYDGRYWEFAVSDSLLRLGIPYHHQKIYSPVAAEYATYADPDWGNGDDVTWRAALEAGAVTGFQMPYSFTSKPLFKPDYNRTGWDWMEYLVKQIFGWTIYANIDGIVVVEPSWTGTTPDYTMNLNQCETIEYPDDPEEVMNEIVVIGKGMNGEPIVAHDVDWGSILGSPPPDNFLGFRRIHVIANENLSTQGIVNMVCRNAMLELGRVVRRVSITMRGDQAEPEAFPGKVILMEDGDLFRIISMSSNLDLENYQQMLISEYLYNVYA